MNSDTDMIEISPDGESGGKALLDECGLRKGQWDPRLPQIYRAGSEEGRITRIAEYIANLVYKGYGFNHCDPHDEALTRELLEENACEITCTLSAMNYKTHERESNDKNGFRNWIICIRFRDTFTTRYKTLKKMICLPKDNEEICYEIMAQIHLILSGSSELMKAIWKGSLKTVCELLKQGVDVNYRNHRGMSALAFAVNPWVFAEGPSQLSDLRIVRELINAGANLDVPHNGGQSHVETALNLRRKDVASLLIKSGAPFNALTVPCLWNHWQTLADIALARISPNFSSWQEHR